MARWIRRKVLLEKSRRSVLGCMEWTGYIGTTRMEVDMQSLEICTIMRFSVVMAKLKLIRVPIFDIIYGSPQAQSAKFFRAKWPA